MITIIFRDGLDLVVRLLQPKKVVWACWMVGIPTPCAGELVFVFGQRKSTVTGSGYAEGGVIVDIFLNILLPWGIYAGVIRDNTIVI